MCNKLKFIIFYNKMINIDKYKFFYSDIMHTGSCGPVLNMTTDPCIEWLALYIVVGTGLYFTKIFYDAYKTPIPRRKTQLTICTHNGRFHCDEVMATAMLKYLHNDKCKIIRTRDENVIKYHQNFSESMVIDIGRVYDPENKCYDHHQEEFNEPFTDKETDMHIPLSSCGLIYRHYGKPIITSMIFELYGGNHGFVSKDIDRIFYKFYSIFVKPIDAHDNGIVDCESKDKAYFHCTLSGIVSQFNRNTSDDVEQYVQFNKAADLCKTIFKEYLTKTILIQKEEALGRKIYEKGLEETDQELKDQGILIFDEDILFHKYLRYDDPEQKFHFVTYPTDKDTYKIKTITKSGSVFKCIKPLITEDEAKERFGEENIVFIHKARFTGEVKNLETSINVLKASVESGKEKAE